MEAALSFPHGVRVVLPWQEHLQAALGACYEPCIGGVDACSAGGAVQAPPRWHDGSGGAAEDILERVHLHKPRRDCKML